MRFENVCRNLSLILLLGICIAPAVVWSQTSPAGQTRFEPTSAPAANVATEYDADEYEASEKALREHLKAMRVENVAFHMSETSAHDKEFRRKWADLCDQGRPIFARAVKAMVNKYSSDPAGNAELEALLYQLLEHNTRDSRFEGMLEVGFALEKGGLKKAKLPAMIALCAIADNEYALAKTLLETMPPESRPELPLLGGFARHIDVLQKDWEEELRLRAEDEKGEPLPQVKIRTTKGSMVVELFENQCPETVANFIYLTEQGFFDGLLFHRVMEHFVAQTGCPEGDGSGGPGYTIYGETDKPNARKYFRGTLGMALSNNEPNSGGSQFFMCFLPNFNLNGKYAAFGRIISGIEVIGNLTKKNPDEEKKKDQPDVILDEVIDITVIRKRNHPYEPNKVNR